MPPSRPRLQRIRRPNIVSGFENQGIEVISGSEDLAAELEKRREWVRAAIALSLVGIFGLTVLAALALVVWTDVEAALLKTLIEILLPAETALLGSAIGFYFGSESR